MGDPKKPKVKKATLAEVVATTNVRPSMAAILDHYFALIGGPEKFAKQLHDEYLAAPPGSLARSKIIDILARGLKSEDAKSGLGDDLGMLSDEDMAREMRRREDLLRPYLVPSDEQRPGRPDAAGQPEPPPPGPAAASPAPDHAPTCPDAGT